MVSDKFIQRTTWIAMLIMTLTKITIEGKLKLAPIEASNNCELSHFYSYVWSVNTEKATANIPYSCLDLPHS